ncbi:MAG: hypothetical protein ABSC62_01995 [Terracidiphilus sp.]
MALFLVTTFTVIEGREPTWEDELCVQSTAWSIVQGRPANMSVDGLFAHDIPLVRFFGPVSFRVAAVWIRLFGLNVLPWRTLCFLFGISLITVSSALLLRLTGAGHWVVLGGASTVMVSTAYCILLPGRWDPVTVGLILAGTLFLLHAVNGSATRLALLACAAGILFGLAAGSTPRALPPLAAVACGVISAACVDAVRRAHLLSAGAVAAFLSLVTDALLLAPLGMTPWSWFQFVTSASKRDPIACPPLLGGQWNLQLDTHKTVSLLTGFLLVSGFLSAWAQRPGRSGEGKTCRVALAVIALANLALSVGLVSRFLGYAIFWLPFLVLASFSWIGWESLRGRGARSLIAALVCLELLLPATLEIRRMDTAVKLWRGRDPQILLTEILSTIPRGSIVFGPIGGYFFPVEQSGSRYLYMENDGTPGLAVGDDTAAYLERALDAAACTAPTFAVWPRDQEDNPLPEEIARHEKIELKSEEVSRSDAPLIYRLTAPGNCSSIQFDVSAIKPFKAF